MVSSKRTFPGREPARWCICRARVAMMFRLDATLQRELVGCSELSGATRGSGGSRGSDDSGGSGRSTLPVVVVAGTDGPLSKLSRNKDNNCAFFIDEGNFNARASNFCCSVRAEFPGLSPSQRLSSLWLGEGVAGLNEAQCPSHCQRQQTKYIHSQSVAESPCLI